MSCQPSASGAPVHRQLRSITGQPGVASMLESISLPTSRARIWHGLTQAGAYPQTLQEHAEILQAIENREPELAAARAMVHIAGVEGWLREVQQATQGRTSGAKMRKPGRVKSCGDRERSRVSRHPPRTVRGQCCPGPGTRVPPSHQGL